MTLIGQGLLSYKGGMKHEKQGDKRTMGILFIIMRKDCPVSGVSTLLSNRGQNSEDFMDRHPTSLTCLAANSLVEFEAR